MFEHSCMKMEKRNLYISLYNGYVKAHATTSKADCQKQVNEIWKGIKSDANVSEKVESLLKEYVAELAHLVKVLGLSRYVFAIAR